MSPQQLQLLLHLFYSHGFNQLHIFHTCQVVSGIIDRTIGVSE